MNHQCQLCSSFAAKSLKALIRHLGLVHAHQAGFYVRCEIQDCPRTYNKFLSYKKHMYSKHRDVLGSLRNDSSVLDMQSSSSVGQDSDEQDGQTDTLSPPCDVNVFTRREAALFVMKAKHVHHIAQSSLCEVMCDFTSLLERSVNKLHSSVCNLLGDVDPALRIQIDEAFNRQEIIDPFYRMTTEHMQNCFFRETFNLLVSLYILRTLVLSLSFIIVLC